jgi:hypothetical protein
MKRLYGILLAIPLLLSLAPPAHAQLSGTWPRRFGNNGNQGRWSVAGPHASITTLAHTYTVANCSAPVVGSGGTTIYVTSSGTFTSNACALYAFTINGSNQLVQSWVVVLTGVAGRFLSAPTLSSGYAFIGAGDISGGAGANLIKVDLGGVHAVTSVNISTLPQTAANVPPFIDSSGNVYVCTESTASGGGARVASYTSSLGLNWKYSVQDQNNGVNDNNPFAGMKMVFKEGSPRSVHFHCWYLNYSEMPLPKRRHKVVGLNASMSGAELYESDNIIDSLGTIGFPSSHPALSDDGSQWYATKIGTDVPGNSGTITLFGRSTGGGGISNSYNIGSGTAGPNGTSVLPGPVDDVFSLFGVLRRFDDVLTNPPASYMYTGTAAPTIDNGGYMYFVDGSGDLRLFNTNTNTLVDTEAASASDEVAIVSGTKLVVKEGTGLGLFTGT